MVTEKCPYCSKEIEIDIAGFAPSTRPEICAHCGEQYHVIDIPGVGIKAVSKDEYEKKYAKDAFKIQ